MTRLPLRALHCADLHLDIYHRQQAIRVLQSLASLERSLAVDVVLLAGDIFESTREPLEFVDEMAERFLAFHAQVIAIPGNHDVPFRQLDPTGQLFQRLGEKGVYLRAPEGQTIEAVEGRLRVWGRGMLEHSPANDPLAHLPLLATDGRWNVVLAHGELLAPGTIAGCSSPISLDQHGPKLHGVDYLALGHAHGPRQMAYNGTVLRDPGAATSVVGTGTATLVDFTEGGLKIVSYAVEQ